MKHFNNYNSEQDLVEIIGYSQLHANILVLYINLKLKPNPNPNPNPISPEPNPNPYK